MSGLRGSVPIKPSCALLSPSPSLSPCAAAVAAADVAEASTAACAVAVSIVAVASTVPTAVSVPETGAAVCVIAADVCVAIIRALEKENNIGERYLVTSENLTFGEINNMISEISGKKLPKFKFPDWLTMMNAYLLTGLANLIRKPPIWDMSVDQISLMKQGFEVDGSKAERELGYSYTPVRVGIEDAIASFS